MKRIVLCFDGTWNTPAEDSVADADKVETNVRRFFRSVADAGPDGVEQEPWYNAGVGTSALNKLAGGAFGAGLDKHILDGYSHLVEVYEPGDEVYVLGFSRGAYTARSLVGMIRNCGLVNRGMLQSLRIGMAYGIYRTRQDGPDSLTARTFRRQFAQEIGIRFLGVWDTVGALGIPGKALERVNSEIYQFHDTKLSKIVERAYHAIAVDEHRAEYDVTLWAPAAAVSNGQILEQRWFVGAHSDVGGGYPSRALSDITLRWMQDMAIAAGLAVSPVGVTPNNIAGPLTDSYDAFLGGLYKLKSRRHFRPILKTSFGQEVVDPSVVTRRATDPSYRPTNDGL